MAHDILEEMLSVSIALSSEKNTAHLLESILLAAKKFANADGGTIYSVNADNELVFDTLFNDSLNLHWGGSSNEKVQFDPIPIYENGQVNQHAVAAKVVAENIVVNIDDIYESTDFDFERAKELDKKNNYRIQSMITLPMVNHEGDIAGALQLVNARDDNKVIPFSKSTERAVLAMASLASVALTNRQLIDSMEELFHAFTQLIAKAIDEKSPYTGGHCRRVPELTMMIAEAVHRHKEGPLADFTMSEADRKELSLAGWIHDCGKVATPEYIMDKAKKLETVFDRIELVKTRFELAKRDIELSYMRKMSALSDDAAKSDMQQALESALLEMDENFEFVKKANTGGEYMEESEQNRLAQIGRSHIVEINGEKVSLLTDEEVYNLSVARGTLNHEERKIVNRHMDITVEMLESLPFPKHLRRVPEFAGGHHEKMDGTGYPKGLKRDEMSVQARMMAIADIFEALTACDRPYKATKKISECLTIMGRMSMNDHIDPDLFDVFVKEKVYIEYANEFLEKDQIDDLPIEKIPGITVS